MTDVVEAAITEARRRQSASDRDLSAAVDHFARTVGPVCARWSLVPECWLPGGAGTPTVAVRTADDAPAVLKIAEPGDLDVAAAVMQAADGHGYARILDWDRDHGALLLERLGPMLAADAPSLSQQGAVIVALLRQAWDVPQEHGRRYESKAAGLLTILADLGPRYAAAHLDAVESAAAVAERLAATERPEVVCHGDAHAGNVLRRGSGWALIDPDGFVGERSYDVGVVLRDACPDLLAAEACAPGAAEALLRTECDRLAAQADVDPQRAWSWAYVERVTTGLYLRWFGHAEQSALFLDTARLLMP